MNDNLKIIIFTLLVCFIPLGAKAESANFATSAIDIDAGDSFSLVVNVSDLEEATTIETVLEYNPLLLNFISIDTGGSIMSPLFGPGILYATSSQGDLERMSVAISSASSTAGSGELLSINFALSANASTTLNIYLHSVTVYNEDLSSSGAALSDDFVISVSPPARTSAYPSGSLVYTTTQTNISLTTDEDAVCHYSALANIIFASSSEMTTTGSTSHSVLITGLSSGHSYDYYIRCSDSLANINNSDYGISFSVASIPSSSGGGGSSYRPPPLVVEEPVSPLELTESTSVREDSVVTLSWVNPVDDNFAKVIVIKSVLKLEDYTLIETAQGLAETIYEGIDELFIDTAVLDIIDYYYLIYVVDKDGNSDLPVLIKIPKITIVEDVSLEMPVVVIHEENFELGEGGLFNVSSDIVETVSRSEANDIMQYGQRVDLNTETLLIYEKVMAYKNIADDDIKYSIAYFIHYGTETTISLGAGERGGVLNSYYSAFAKMPQTESEWMDVIKIANGRWPNERNLELEEENKVNAFNKIYKRMADMDNANDNAAVTVISYGLRPSNRSLDSEKTAINFFRAIFDYDPSGATDWDIVRAISYSGAIR